MKQQARGFNPLGKRFGMLVVMRQATSAETPIGMRQHRCWMVRCDCGVARVLRGRVLRPGKQISCGCAIHNPAHNRKPYGEASQRHAYKNALSAARSRDIAFTLTFTQFIAIVTRPCYYCGITWSKEISRRDGSIKHKFNGAFRCCGIDRIDSSKGYAAGNCRPACGTCNVAKASMSDTDFTTWVERIYSHLIKGGDYVEA